MESIAEEPLRDRGGHEAGLRLTERILSKPEKHRYDGAAEKSAAKLTGEGLCGSPNHTAFGPDYPRIMIMDGCYVAVLKK